MNSDHPVLIPKNPQAARIAHYVIEQRDSARLGDSVMVPAYMAAQLLALVAESEALDGQHEIVT